MIRLAGDRVARVEMDDGGTSLAGADGGFGDFLGVTGRCGDMEGVWMEPVTAQVMMTFD